MCLAAEKAELLVFVELCGKGGGWAFWFSFRTKGEVLGLGERLGQESRMVAGRRFTVLQDFNSLDLLCEALADHCG